MVMFQRHYNRAMGKMVHTKEDYLKNMKDMNLVPQKEADQRVKDNHKPYDKPSDSAMRFMTHITKRKTKDGNIKLSGNEIKEMKKLGVNFDKAKERPLNGGFE